MPSAAIPVFFHRAQLEFRPEYEWVGGARIEHPEKWVRAQNIVDALRQPNFSLREPSAQPLEQIRAQHAPDLLRLYDRSATLEPGQTVYPSVFLHAAEVEPDPDDLQHAGFYCYDSGTPLTRELLEAIRWSAACAVDAAQSLVNGESKLAYALSRPPGHHAMHERFGGYSYINNNALAARTLQSFGRVVVIDIDVHHGNGTQSLFWNDPDVLTVSIHNDPRDAFPYVTGFTSETGGELAKGLNLNVPLPVQTDGQAYEQAFERFVVPTLRDFAPDALVVAAGVDAYEKDPVGKFALKTEDFFRVGERLGALGLPTCVVQEGGYHTPDIGKNVCAVLEGIASAQ